MKTWTTGSGSTVARVLSGRSNAFLLSRNGRNILVDTGRKSSRGLLMDGLRTMGVAAIDALVLTHTHFDHAENAAFIKREFSAKVIVHASEAGFLREGSSPLPAGTLLPTRPLTNLFAKKVKSSFAYESCHFDIGVEDGIDLSDFGFDAYLLHTPGHSRGSISLLVDREIALVGDAMFGVFPRSIFPPFADDVEELIRSWGALLRTGCTLFIPAHGSADDRKLVERCYGRRLR